MRAGIWMGLLLTVAAGRAHAEPDRTGLVCVFPASKPLPECFKGSATSERAVDACERRNAKRKQVPPRIRIDAGAWVTFAPDHWRCVAAPVGKAFRFQLENHGKLYYSDETTIPARCASLRVDLTRANFYGAMWASCSKRKSDRDEVVTP